MIKIILVFFSILYLTRAQSESLVSIVLSNASSTIMPSMTGVVQPSDAITSPSIPQPSMISSHSMLLSQQSTQTAPLNMASPSSSGIISSTHLSSTTLPEFKQHSSTSTIPAVTTSQKPPTFAATSDSDSQPRMTSSSTPPSDGRMDGSMDIEDGILSDLKYIYIIAGVILLLILIIVCLIAIVIVMCQRKHFDNKQMKKMKAKAARAASANSISPQHRPPPPVQITSPTSVVVADPYQRQNSAASTPAVDRYQRQNSAGTPMQSPKRSASASKSLENSISKSGSLKRKPDENSMSDFPLLCRVLQDYDSTHHKARQTSVSSSNEIHGSPLLRRSETAPANGAIHHAIPLLPPDGLTGYRQETTEPVRQEVSEQVSDNVFLPVPLNKPVQMVRPVANSQPSSSTNNHKTPVTISQEPNSTSNINPPSNQSNMAAHQQINKQAPHLNISGNVPGSRDSHDYDELDTLEDSKTPLKSPPQSVPGHRHAKQPIGAVHVLPLNFQTLKPANTVARNESIKRSQSTNDIFDDPKYTRMSVGSSAGTAAPHPMGANYDIYDRLGPDNLTLSEPKESNQLLVKSPVAMKRSFSTLPSGELSVAGTDGKKHKDYMSLKHLIEIMDTKIPSREASVETDYQDDMYKLYDVPRVPAAPVLQIKQETVL